MHRQTFFSAENSQSSNASPLKITLKRKFQEIEDLSYSSEQESSEERHSRMNTEQNDVILELQRQLNLFTRKTQLLERKIEILEALLKSAQDKTNPTSTNNQPSPLR